MDTPGGKRQPSGIVIRSEITEDIPEIRAIHRAAFRGDAEASLVDNLRASGDAVYSIVALKAGRLLGHILFSRITAPMPALSLAPLAVHPDFQRMGIGSALIKSSLKQITASHWAAVFVLGNPNYYGRFGFDVNAAKGYECPYSGNHFMVLPVGNNQLLSTGRLIYPAPFSLLG